MGFFSDDLLPFSGKKSNTGTSLELLHTLSCRICPRNHLNIHSPKMEATGSKHPDIYILGESPGSDEDKEGRQFVGKSGTYLREAFGQKWLARARFLNTVNCYNNNITPEFPEIEACRPRVVADIEQTKPKAILGFGAIPLQFAIGEATVGNWRGRRIPIFVGNHKVWYYPIHHPAHIVRLIDEKKPWQDMPEDERFFRLDLRRALRDMSDLPAPDPHDPARAIDGVECIYDCTPDDSMLVEQYLDWAGGLESGVDIETPPVRPYADQACIATVAVSVEGSTLAFPIDHPEARWSPVSKERVIVAFKRFLKSQGRKAVHSLGFELEYFGKLYGIEYVRAAPWDDTMSQAFVLDQRASKNRGGKNEDEGTLECYSLGFLTKAHFGLNIKTLSKVNRENIMNEPLSRVLPYNGMDAKYHRELKRVQDGLLEREGLTHVYQDHLRRVPTCTLTQIKGVPLDQGESRKLAVKYDAEIADVSGKIQEAATAKLFFQRFGRRLNPSSNPDLIMVCRDLLKSEAGQRRNGKYSVDEETLNKIKDPLMALILKYRHATKRRSTYVFDDQNPVVWPDGMLHQRLNTCVARTSRLTAADPNTQNQEKRTKEGKQMRKQIKARPGYVFLSADYGQIQPRIFAMVSHDRTFMKSLWENYDIHGEWARRIATAVPSRADINDKDAMKVFRQDVKTDWVLAQFFGAALATVAPRLKVDEALLKPIREQFMKEFEGIFAWQDDNHKFYQKHGYVEFLTGRRRCGPLSYNEQTNTPIQMGEAEITLDGANRISEMGVWDLQPSILVHDDNVLHLPADKVEETVEILVKEMVKPDIFDFINVPIVVEVSIGDDWCDMHSSKELTYSSAEFYPKSAHLGLKEGEL